MGKFAQFLIRTGAVAAVMALVIGCAGSIEAAGHPRLVSVEASKCSMCHAKLTRGAKVIHAPVKKDCTSCHDVSVTKEGTTVTLSAPEPGLCIQCHDDLAAAAAGQLEFSHAPVTDSCLTCHLPHAGDQPALLKESKTRLCEGCHEIEDLKVAHGGQITKSVNCTACHLPHGGAAKKLLIGPSLHAPVGDGSCETCHRPPFAGRIRLRARGEKICSACHGDLREGVKEGGSIHGALEGTRTRAGCLSCHDPHLSPNPKLLSAPGNALCGRCHSTIVQAAGADTGHAPAAEDCGNCHKPHTSNLRSLLVKEAPALCLECHDPDDPDLRATHLGASLGALDCTGCHSPHGDGNEHLLAKNVHAVLSEGCETCHEGAFDRLIDDGASTLCLGCHDDIGEYAETAVVPHGAMNMVRCVECHNPHASAQPRLVNAPSGGECTGCHDDKAAEENEFAHGVIDLLGCQACHQPHGSANVSLLRMTGSDLCLECHDAKRVTVPAGVATVTLMGRFEVSAENAKAMAVLKLSADGQHGHPMQDHRVLGEPSADEIGRTKVEFSGALECLSCHDPHKGRSRRLFAGGAASRFELCSECHTK